MSTAQRVHKHRQSLRKKGLKPFQIWVYDAKNKDFLDECDREMDVINAVNDDALEAFNAIADTEGWV